MTIPLTVGDVKGLFGNRKTIGFVDDRCPSVVVECCPLPGDHWVLRCTQLKLPDRNGVVCRPTAETFALDSPNASAVSSSFTLN